METAAPIPILSEAHILTHGSGILRTHSLIHAEKSLKGTLTLLLCWLVYLVFA